MLDKLNIHRRSCFASFADASACGTSAHAILSRVPAGVAQW